MRPRSVTGLLAGAAIVVTGLVTLDGSPRTYSSYSDFATARGSAGATVWAPDPPAACGPLSAYVEVVWGTPGDDVFVGDHLPRIYMGLEGRDRLSSTSAADCLVGGQGRDRLVGHERTIVVPDPSDEVLLPPDGPFEEGDSDLPEPPPPPRVAPGPPSTVADPAPPAPPGPRPGAGGTGAETAVEQEPEPKQEPKQEPEPEPEPEQQTAEDEPGTPDNPDPEVG